MENNGEFRQSTLEFVDVSCSR